MQAGASAAGIAGFLRFTWPSSQVQHQFRRRHGDTADLSPRHQRQSAVLVGLDAMQTAIGWASRNDTVPGDPSYRHTR